MIAIGCNHCDRWFSPEPGPGLIDIEGHTLVAHPDSEEAEAYRAAEAYMAAQKEEK